MSERGEKARGIVERLVHLDFRTEVDTDKAIQIVRRALLAAEKQGSAETESLIVVDFYPQTFAEIPRQDNPAFSDDECMMIVGGYGSSKGHAVVLHIKPSPVESVNHIAKFWQYEAAVKFSHEFAT